MRSAAGEGLEWQIQAEAQAALLSASLPVMRTRTLSLTKVTRAQDATLAAGPFSRCYLNEFKDIFVSFKAGLYIFLGFAV